MSGLLDGIRVVEVGQLVAGPYASALLAELGADVIKVESPRGGDASRGIAFEGRPLLWWIENRDKRCVAIDLRDSRGQDVFLRLLSGCDVLIENSRPGTFDGWGLTEAALRRANPRLVIGRISGYGQSGPYRDRACTDRQALAASGVTYLTGHADSPPVRPGVPVSDYVAGVHTALAVLAAVYGRDVNNAEPETVDIALIDGMLRMTQGLAQEFLDTRRVRERTGNRNASVPGEVFASKDGAWLVISVGTDRNWVRLAEAMGRDDWTNDPGLALNEGRRDREQELLQGIEHWVGEHTAQWIEDLLASAGVPCSRVLTAADLLEDPQLLHRQSLVTASTEDGEDVVMPSSVGRFKFSRRPPGMAGRALGADTMEVLTAHANARSDELRTLLAEGVLAVPAEDSSADCVDRHTVSE